MNVWDKGEDYNNLMFLKESNKEDFKKELEKKETEINNKNLVIKELNPKVANSDDSEKYINKKHKYHCKFCEYSTTTRERKIKPTYQ